MRTLDVVKRNFQISFNMKSSSFIMILGPLLLIALIGVALQDTSLKNIEAGVHSETGFADQFSTTILKKINDNGINTKSYERLDACKETVKDGTSQVCIDILEPTKNSAGQTNQDVEMHVDFSKQRTVWAVIGRVQEIIGEESTQERDILINDIKSGSADALIEIEKQKNTINTALQELNKIENNYLVQIKQLSDSTNNKIENVNNRLDDIWGDLNQVKSLLKLLGEDSSDIDNALYDLSSAKSTLNSVISSNNPDTYLKKVEDSIKNAKQYLEDTLKSLDETKAKVKDLNEMDFDRIMHPIKVSYSSVLSKSVGEVNQELEFLDYLFPSFLIFFILFNAVVFSATLRLRERNSGSHLRNTISKVKGRTFVLGDFITSLILVSIQSMAIIYIASFFLNLSVLGSLTNLIWITIIAVSIFSTIGLAIGSAFDSQESVIITSISVALLLFILSSIVTPIETLPSNIAFIVGLTPLTLLETKIRLSMIFGNALMFNGSEIIALSGVGLISAWITRFFYKRKIAQEM